LNIIAIKALEAKANPFPSIVGLTERRRAKANPFPSFLFVERRKKE
jgi:hypothetical protein